MKPGSTRSQGVHYELDRLEFSYEIAPKDWGSELTHIWALVRRLVWDIFLHCLL